VPPWQIDACGTAMKALEDIFLRPINPSPQNEQNDTPMDTGNPHAERGCPFDDDTIGG
jgi:hypothetical protein